MLSYIAAAAAAAAAAEENDEVHLSSIVDSAAAACRFFHKLGSRSVYFIYLFIWSDAMTAYKQIMPRLTTAV